MAGAAQFVGRQVQLKTNSDELIGTVASIDNGQLSLINVFRHGQPIAQATVSGADIQDLKVLPPSQAPRPVGSAISTPVASQTPPVPMRIPGMMPYMDSSYYMQPSPGAAPAAPQPHIPPYGYAPAYPAVPSATAAATPPVPETGNRTSNGTTNNERKPKGRHGKGKLRQKQYHDDSFQNEVDVREEFDFEENLERFDKAAVFDEIRNLDTVGADQRLVAHNKKNYGNEEMILEPSRPRDIAGPANSLYSAYGAVPLATPLQLVQLELALIASGRTASALTELAARGIADVALRALGLSRFDSKNHNEMPVVVVFAGPNRSGARALAAGRLLATRQITVMAVILTDAEQLSSQERVFTGSGGKVVRTQQELLDELESMSRPVELVVDGLQGFESTLEDVFEPRTVSAANGLIKWANRTRAPKLAVDVPSRGDEPVNAQWIAACGFPLTAIGEVASQAKIYIVDLAVSAEALATAGMRRFSSVWFGALSVMPVEPR